MARTDDSANLDMSIDAAEASARARRLLVETAEQTYKEATFHKHAAQHHRRQTKVMMARFDAFRRELEAMGITVEVGNHQDPLDRSPSDRSN